MKKIIKVLIPSLYGLSIAMALLLLYVVIADAAVTVNSTRDIDGTKQWVMISLTVDGDLVRYTTVQP